MWTHSQLLQLKKLHAYFQDQYECVCAHIGTDQ